MASREDLAFVQMVDDVQEAARQKMNEVISSTAGEWGYHYRVDIPHVINGYNTHRYFQRSVVERHIRDNKIRACTFDYIVYLTQGVRLDLPNDVAMILFFRDIDDALMFKLTWEGLWPTES